MKKKWVKKKWRQLDILKIFSSEISKRLTSKDHFTNYIKVQDLKLMPRFPVP